MPERFEILTTIKRTQPIMADFYETTIYDRKTGNSVRCAGDTPVESRANAEVYLEVLNRLKGSHQEKE